MSASTPTTSRVFLRPIGGVLADGTQLYEMSELDVLTWSSTVTYGLGVTVAGSDGKVYVSKVARNKGNNPVGDVAVHWVSLVG